MSNNLLANNFTLFLFAPIRGMFQINSTLRPYKENKFFEYEVDFFHFRRKIMM